MKTILRVLLVLTVIFGLNGCNSIVDPGNGPVDPKAIPDKSTLVTSTSYLKALPSVSKLGIQVPGNVNQLPTNVSVGNLPNGGSANVDINGIGFKVAMHVERLVNRVLGHLESLTAKPSEMKILDEAGVVGSFEYNGRAVLGPRVAPIRQIELMLNIYRGIDPNDGRMAFVYILQGRAVGAGDDAWLVLLEGGVKSVDGYEAGMVLLDLDVLNSLEPLEDGVGKITFLYEKTPTSHVAAIFGDALSSGIAREVVGMVDAKILYAQFNGQSDDTSDEGGGDDTATNPDDGLKFNAIGEFGFYNDKNAAATTEPYTVVQVDVCRDLPFDKGTADEQLHVIVGWLESGSGRADASASGGDLVVSGNMDLSVCWDETIANYIHLSGGMSLPVVGNGEITIGSESACFSPDPLTFPDVDFDAIQAAFEALFTSILE